MTGWFRGMALAAACAASWPGAAAPSLVPKPVSMTPGAGAFTLDQGTRIQHSAGQAEAGRVAALLAQALRPATGLELPVEAAETPGANAIALAIEPDDALGPEGYTLTATPEGVRIAAPAPAGLFYGMQTLRQLLPAAVYGGVPAEGAAWSVPCVAIRDYPRFAWRGMCLDVARHFMPKTALLDCIDALAAHKLNSLHLHLTDDQGWRIEIKRYPKLTAVGSRRAETLVGHAREKPWRFDGKPHGGFYTQDDIREIVAYAAARYVNIVPEIEMPGHAQAAVAAYPELGNLSEPLDVWTGWGVNKNIFNAEEHTILFLQNVLTEVLELFPSRYIHVGGDEAVKDQWRASEAVQARIKALGLADEAEMQSYFIRRMDQFLTKHGRRLIGWDEILEGGLAEGATVMSWRGAKGGIAAAKAGHDVVMAPTTHTYFDYYQAEPEDEPLAIGGRLPLEQVYAFDPIPAELTPAQAQHILGAQGQLWTEYIATPEHLEYMAWPRLAALAEVVWTPQDARAFDDFRTRIEAHCTRLDALGINYRPLD